jgi:hypothetical protein
MHGHMNVKVSWHCCPISIKLSSVSNKIPPPPPENQIQLKSVRPIWSCCMQRTRHTDKTKKFSTSCYLYSKLAPIPVWQWHTGIEINGIPSIFWWSESQLVILQRFPPRTERDNLNVRTRRTPHISFNFFSIVLLSLVPWGTLNMSLPVRSTQYRCAEYPDSLVFWPSKFGQIGEVSHSIREVPDSNVGQKTILIEHLLCLSPSRRMLR